ncbi:MAG: magnesium/cobalt transporter CorA [Acidobacteriota bacterium]|nr:magnesium/cobalt transporter CorA [Acidobacteriota bacterium]
MRTMRKPPVGARPGTLAIPSDATKSVLRVLSYDAETIEEYDSPNLAEIRELTETGRRLWVDVQGLGDEQLLRGLAELFKIHPLALEDLVNVPVRPKTESYDRQLLVIAQMPRSTDDLELSLRQVSVVIGRDYLLTFQEGREDALEPVRKRLEVQNSLIRRSSSDYLGYAVLDTIVDAYYPVVESMGARIEELEEHVLADASPETLRELNSTKGRLLALRRGITPQREAVNKLIRDESELVSQQVRPYLRDTYDHVVQTTEAVESARELVNGLINTYLSVISNRMNEVMKTLTIVASIFVPLTFMAGIYGMNFENMPELQQQWAYPALLVLMALTTGGMVLYFWRKGWIGRRR